MAQTGYTPIILFNSTTTGNAPTTGNLAVGELAINIADGKLFFNKSGTITTMANASLQIAGGSPQYAVTLTATGATNVTLPTSGYVVSSVTQLGANPVTGTPSSTTFLRGDGTWATAGTNITLTNDTLTATNLYPVFATSTSGTVTGLNTGNAKLLYKPSTGDLQSEQFIAGNGLFINNQTINTSYSIPTTQSAMSTGPITLAASVSVTLASGARWIIL
jgi:hypothetical protein